MSNKRRKSEYLLSEIGGIDEGFLAEAESYRKKRAPSYLKPAVAVACACLIVVGALGVVMNGGFMAKGEASMDNVPENNAPVHGEAHSSVQNKDESAFENSDGTTSESTSGMLDEMTVEGRLYLPQTGRVGMEALLVDSTGNLLWVYAKYEGFYDGFNSGDYVKISHGPVMQSYPGQTYAESIALIENGDVYSFTDEEWKRLSIVLVENPER